MNQCPNCGHTVSGDNESCPNCGQSLSRDKKRKNKTKQQSSQSQNNNATNLKLRRIVPLGIVFYFNTYCGFIFPIKEL